MAIKINVDDIIDILEVEENNTGVSYGNNDIDEKLAEQFKILVSENPITTEVEFVYMGVSISEIVRSEHDLVPAWHRVRASVKAI